MRKKSVSLARKQHLVVDGKRYYPACVLCCDLVRRKESGKWKWFCPGTKGEYYAQVPCDHCQKKGVYADDWKPDE